MESLPPTENALLQHVKRCIYQVGVWYNSFYAHPLQPYSPVNYGWREDESGWTPVWITIPEVALSCRDLIKCGCKTNCISARCKCCGADLPCCHLCSCKCLTPVAALSSGFKKLKYLLNETSQFVSHSKKFFLINTVKKNNTR